MSQRPVPRFRLVQKQRWQAVHATYTLSRLRGRSTVAQRRTPEGDRLKDIANHVNGKEAQ